VANGSRASHLPAPTDARHLAACASRSRQRYEMRLNTRSAASRPGLWRGCIQSRQETGPTGYRLRQLITLLCHDRTDGGAEHLAAAPCGRRRCGTAAVKRIAIPASNRCGCQVPRASRALARISLGAFRTVSSPGPSICPRGRRLASGRLLLAKHHISSDLARDNLVNKIPPCGPTCRRNPECSHGATPVRCPGRRGLFGIEAT
jgi:hypothetical protein